MEALKPVPERLQPQTPQNAEMLRQIQAAWEEAQAQLHVLKSQVEHAAAMAQAKVGSNMLDRDLDRAYRDLGEAVWAEVSKGKRPQVEVAEVRRVEPSATPDDNSLERVPNSSAPVRSSQRGPARGGADDVVAWCCRSRRPSARP